MSVDLIIAGDLHADLQTPECRCDNYLDALCAKVKWIADLQKKHKCTVVFPGDLVNRWLVTSELLNPLIEVWPRAAPVLAVPGQHDLPQHSTNEQHRCGYETLARMKLIVDLSKGDCFVHKGLAIYGLAWGQEPFEPQHTNSVLIWHKTTWMNPIKPGDKKNDAERLLKATKGFDLIVTGDNHQTFNVRLNNRQLINPGSVMRKRSDQIDFKPCVYLWCKNGDCARLDIPIVKDAVSRAKLEKIKQREERENIFVQSLGQWIILPGDTKATFVPGNSEAVSLSFNENVQCMLKGKSAEVKETVLECIGL